MTPPSIDKMDVNVTPDKRTVLLHSEKVILAIVQCSLDKLYSGLAGLCPSIGVPSLPPSDAVPSSQNSSPALGVKRTAQDFVSGSELLNPKKQGRLDSFVLSKPSGNIMESVEESAKYVFEAVQPI